MSTISDARLVLGLGQQFTADELQAAWKTAALKAHPDAGGTDQAMAELNAARDLLAPLATTRTVRRPAAEKEHLLVISTSGEVFGPEGFSVGRCGSVAAAEKFCKNAGWAYQLSRELQAA
jgi:hypothetical protein